MSTKNMVTPQKLHRFSLTFAPDNVSIQTNTPAHVYNIFLTFNAKFSQFQ